MSYMDLKRETSAIENPAEKSTFRSSSSPSYAIRPALPSSYSPTIYTLTPTTSIPPTPRYTHNRPASTTFVRFLPKTMSSPLPHQPPNPSPAAAEVSMYDHDDPMGIVKYLKALEIAEGRPDPLAPPSPPSAPPLMMAYEKKPEPLPPPPHSLCARVD